MAYTRHLKIKAALMRMYGFNVIFKDVENLEAVYQPEQRPSWCSV